MAKTAATCATSQATTSTATSPASGWNLLVGPGTTFEDLTVAQVQTGFTTAGGSLTTPDVYCYQRKTTSANCNDWTDKVSVTIRPDVSDAVFPQPSIEACADPTKPYAILAATTPTVGSGTWSIVSGDGTLSSTTANPTTITGLSEIGGSTTIKWEVAYPSSPGPTCTKSQNRTLSPTALSLSTVSMQSTLSSPYYTCLSCSVKDNNTYVYYDNSGRIVAKIQDPNSNGQELQSTEVCMGYSYNPASSINYATDVKTVTTNYGDQQPYLPRFWSIKPSAATDVIVTLYYTAAELNALRQKASSGAYAFSDEFYSLNMTKYPGGVGGGAFIAPASTGGVNVPVTITKFANLSTGLDYAVTFSINSFSTFYLHPQRFPFAPLPVELVTFTGYNDRLKNILNWTTASEINADRFEIQKLSDTNNDWQYIGEVVAAGNSQGQKDYTFIDAAPFVGNNYYRLKMIDNDGTFTYSNTINIPISEAIVNSFINIFPNPTTGNVKVLLQSIKEKASELSITNLLGQQVLTIPATLQKGINTVTFDISNLASGTYLISFIDETGIKHTTKLIKE